MDVLELFETYRHTVWRLALQYTGSVPDAEDVSQAVFLKAMENIHKLEPGKEKAWLCRVTVNQCRSLYRSPWRRKTVHLEDTMPAPDGESRAVWLALGELSGKDRAAVYLHYFEGFSVKEIAEQMGVTPSAVTSRLQRARAKMKETLE